MDEQPKKPSRRGPRVPKPVEADRVRPRGLRELPHDLRDLADGRVDRLRRPVKPKDPLEDDRIGHVVPGVRNTEARVVYDRRVAALRAALVRGDEARLAEGLAEAQSLGLWRARNVTDFSAFAEDVIGVAPERAEGLAQAGAEHAGSIPDPLPLDVVALWIRTEASLAQLSPGAEVRVAARGHAGTLSLEIQVPVQPTPEAIEALRSISGAVTGLTRLLGEQPISDRRPAREDFQRGPRRDDRSRGGRADAWAPREGGSRERGPGRVALSGGFDRSRPPAAPRPSFERADREAAPGARSAFEPSEGRRPEPERSRLADSDAEDFEDGAAFAGELDGARHDVSERAAAAFTDDVDELDSAETDDSGDAAAYATDDDALDRDAEGDDSDVEAAYAPDDGDELEHDDGADDARRHTSELDALTSRGAAPEASANPFMRSADGGARLLGRKKHAPVVREDAGDEREDWDPEQEGSQAGEPRERPFGRDQAQGAWNVESRAEPRNRGAGPTQDPRQRAFNDRGAGGPARRGFGPRDDARSRTFAQRSSDAPSRGFGPRDDARKGSFANRGGNDSTSRGFGPRDDTRKGSFASRGGNDSTSRGFGPRDDTRKGSTGTRGPSSERRGPPFKGRTDDPRKRSFGKRDDARTTTVDSKTGGGGFGQARTTRSDDTRSAGPQRRGDFDPRNKTRSDARPKFGKKPPPGKRGGPKGGKPFKKRK